jgi:hypothetical protein
MCNAKICANSPNRRLNDGRFFQMGMGDPFRAKGWIPMDFCGCDLLKLPSRNGLRAHMPPCRHSRESGNPFAWM